MIRSMTGFGTADGRVGAARVTVEVRTVNHRFFNPSLKLPTALALQSLADRSSTRGCSAVSHELVDEADELFWQPNGDLSAH